MRIHYVRTGGFAGMRLATTIDSDTLPEDEASVLEHELNETQFFSLPDQLVNQEGGADRFNYEITVEHGGKTHTVQAGETALPEPMQQLVQHLDRLARENRAKK
jgi:hypothetical protein